MSWSWVSLAGSAVSEISPCCAPGGPEWERAFRLSPHVSSREDMHFLTYKYPQACAGHGDSGVAPSRSLQTASEDASSPSTAEGPPGVGTYGTTQDGVHHEEGERSSSAKLLSWVWGEGLLPAFSALKSEGLGLCSQS